MCSIVISSNENKHSLQQKAAQEVLVKLQNHPDAWQRVDLILEFSTNQETKVASKFDYVICFLLEINVDKLCNVCMKQVLVTGPNISHILLHLIHTMVDVKIDLNSHINGDWVVKREG